MRGRASFWIRRSAAPLFALAALASGLLAPGVAVADPEAQAAIVGGEAASILAFPALTYIQGEGRKGENFACTGTVISPRVILTAAHCVEDLDAGGYTAAAGYRLATGFADPRDAKTAKQVRRVSSTHVFPGFDPGTLRGDAGILILATPTAAPPIALPSRSESALFEGGTKTLIAGWGLTGGSAASPPRRLRSAATAVEDPQACKRRTRNFYAPYSTALQLCTRNPPTLSTGTCFGDSGGPAIAQRPDGSPVEIGITSTGGPGCNPRLPDVFTRTDRISAWASGWIAATEAGAPAPALPRARIPRMELAAGEGFVESTLVESFGKRFLRARDLEAACHPPAGAHLQCGLQWRYGPTIYYGTVTVFYALRRNAVIWDSRLAIRSVNARCVSVSQHPYRCPTRTRHRLR